MISLNKWFHEVKRGEDHHQFGKHHKNYIDVVGQKFGKLLAVEWPPGKGVHCVCDCGRSHVEENSVNLRNGRRKSCGKCTNRSSPNFSHEEDALIKKLAGTCSPEQIANELNKIGRRVATVPTVKNRAKRLSISLRRHGDLYPHTKNKDHDVELCRQLKDAGLTNKEIAEKMEMPLGSVSVYTCFIRRHQYSPNYK